MVEQARDKRENRCVWCWLKRIVTSVTKLSGGETRLLGWMCKSCYDKIPLEEKAARYMFGHEGFISGDRTVWIVQNAGDLS